MRVVRSTEIELPVLKELIKNLAEYYFIQLSENQIQMYAEDLLEMGSDLALQAAKKYRLSTSKTSFPLPANLKQTVRFHSNTYLKVS